MSDQVWSYIVTFVGLIGFYLAGGVNGKRIWWAWYVNIFNQVLWVIFAFVTGYFAFLLGTLFYTIVFVRNAYVWTQEHFLIKSMKNEMKTMFFEEEDKQILHGEGTPITGLANTAGIQFDGSKFDAGLLKAQQGLGKYEHAMDHMRVEDVVPHKNSLKHLAKELPEIEVDYGYYEKDNPNA